MNQFAKLALIAALGVSTFASCSKEEEKIETVQPTIYTPETAKKVVEDNSTQLVSEMKGMMSSPSMTTINQLMSLNLGSAIDPIAAGLAKGNLPQTAEAVADSSMAGQLKGAYGTYTYSKATGQWSKTATADKIIVKFPSKNESTTNDATLELSGVAFAKVKDVAGGKDQVEMPTSLKLELTVGTAKTLTYTFAATYNAAGIPATLLQSLVAGEYSLNHSYAGNKSSVSNTINMKRNATVVLGWGIQADGNFTEDQIRALSSIGDEKDTYAGVTRVGNVLTNYSMYYQVLNLKLAGSVAVKDMATYVSTAKPSGAPNDAFIAEMNKDIKLTLTTVDKGDVLASGVFVKNADGTDVDVNVKYSDNSQVTSEVYFNQTLAPMVEKMQKDLGLKE